MTRKEIRNGLVFPVDVSKRRSSLTRGWSGLARQRRDPAKITWRRVLPLSPRAIRKSKLTSKHQLLCPAVGVPHIRTPRPRASTIAMVDRASAAPRTRPAISPSPPSPRLVNQPRRSQRVRSQSRDISDSEVERKSKLQKKIKHPGVSVDQSAIPGRQRGGRPKQNHATGGLQGTHSGLVRKCNGHSSQKLQPLLTICTWRPGTNLAQSILLTFLRF